MGPPFDVFGVLQSMLISLAGWIGVRVERTISRLERLEKMLVKLSGATDVLATKHEDDQKANERRLNHAEDDIRYLTRKHDHDRQEKDD